jgi:predicted TIM-barrel fold metal-dependent hydrolase
MATEADWRWIDTVRAAIAQLSTTERERILGGTAIDAYGLRVT